MSGLNRSGWIDLAGSAGLLLFSFGVFYRTLLVHEGLLLMAAAFAFRCRSLKLTVLRDPLILLSFAFLLLLLVRTLLAVAEFPEHRSAILEGALRSVQIGFFAVYVAAFWMHRCEGRWDWLVVTLLAGFALRVLRKLDWSDLAGTFQSFWIGEVRAAIGSTPNRFGLWNAVILLACLVLHRQIWGTSENKAVRYARTGFWGFIAAASLMGLFFSQSRSAWIAAAVTILPAVMWKLGRGVRARMRTKAAVAALFGLVALMGVFWDVLENRVHLDADDYLDILYGNGHLEGQTQNVAMDSIAERLLIYRLFGEKWSQRPWFGYGPGTSAILIHTASEEFARISVWNHFHNLAFDILIQLGIAGLLFYAAFAYLVFKQLWHGRRSGQLGPDYFVFLFGALMLVLIGSLPGQALGDYKGVYLVGFVGGMAYACRFAAIKPPSVRGSVEGCIAGRTAYGR
jgi:O-antigen ligase